MTLEITISFYTIYPRRRAAASKLCITTRYLFLPQSNRTDRLGSWSVNVLLPDGRGFFPDFVVGVEGRKTEDGILLAEPKLNFARAEEVPKTQAAHKIYGRVLVLHQQSGASDWMVVRYDERSGKPGLDRKFLLADAAGFS